MSVETVLFSRLSEHTGLNALVSTRVYPNLIPQNATMPVVSYHRISTHRESAMGVDTGVARARFQLDAFAATYSAVRAVAEQIRAALQRWTNASGTVVQDSFILGEQEFYEDETKRFRVSQDFEIIYVEA